MVQAGSSSKNIWVAASDGDLSRVRALIEGGQSPNAKDSNSYTPIHAAASYAHTELLEYLLSVGGDINITDSDGDTPLFTVESLDMARWMIDHGADKNMINEEGLNAAQALEDEHPEISAYLNGASTNIDGETPAVSALAVENYTSTQTANLIAQSQAIMAEAERTGEDPDERLREVVQQAVRDGFTFGGGLGGQNGGTEQDGDGSIDGEKRARTNGN